MPGMEVYGDEERKEVMDVLETGALFRYGQEHIRKGMWKTAEFEEEVKKYTGAKYAHAVSSGSTGVSAIMAGAGIGYGDEIIVPPFTFVAPIEAVFLAGGLPVFAELDESLCLSAEGIEKAVTPNTKAVLLVHMCGTAADIDGILEVCKKHDLVLLEDCGQAMGAFYNGKSVGLYGKAGSFSFDYFKIATCGEGGMVITDDEQIYHDMEHFSDHGHTHIGDNRGMEEHHIMGFNFRMSELSGAIGLAQMRKVPMQREALKKNKAILMERLSGIEEIEFRKYSDPEGDSGTFLNFFMPTAELTEKLFDEFSKNGVGGAAYWYKNMYHFINQWNQIKEMKFPAKLAIHELGAPQDYKNLELPKSQDVMSRLVSMGLQVKWTEAEVNTLADNIIKSIKAVI